MTEKRIERRWIPEDSGYVPEGKEPEGKEND